MPLPWLLILESNATGTGRLYVRAARELGLEPVMLAADPSRYDYLEPERVRTLVVDTRDRAALREAHRCLARERPVAGLACFTDYFAAEAAALARELALPGPSPRAVRRCRNKLAQRLHLARAGVAMPGFEAAPSPEAAVAVARRLGWPVVVKPLRGSGSVGVRLCSTEAEVRDHAGDLLRHGRDGRGGRLPPRVLVEGCVEGAEFSVETFDRRVIGITAKYLGRPPWFVEIGHDYPASPAPNEAGLLRRAAIGALDALGLGWGPAHLEFRLAADGPRLIEVNPRLAGGYIPELVRLAEGIDLFRESLRKVAGREPELDPSASGHASIRFLLAPREGTVREVEGVAGAAGIPGVAEVAIKVGPGADLKILGDWHDRIGHVIAAGDSARSAAEAADRALGELRVSYA